MSSPAVSIFKTVMDKSPEETTIEAIVKHIKSDAYKEAVENIRKLQAEEKKKEADQLKRKLPAFAPSGVFKGGHAKAQLVEYNGVLLLDFDHVHPDLLQALLKLCRECEYTLACWTTISGGIRVLVMTDGGEEEHLTAFLAVSAYYEKLLGIKSDPACKDYSHLSFVSYDPDAYYKEDSLLFSVPLQRTGLEALLEQFNKYNSWAHGTRNDSTFKFGLKANEQGFSEMETAAFCASNLSAADFDAEEIRTAIASAFKENRTFAPTQNTPPESSIGARGAEVHLMRPFEGYETPLDVDKLADLEDLIEKAPFVQSFVYDNLPLRLDRAIRHCKNERQRDVMLLSTMVALSACLPKVTGRYGPKTYSTHLFFFLLAEAASGKGEMEFAGKLLNKLDDRFQLRYEEDLIKYKREHDRWEFNKDAAFKAHKEYDTPGLTH